MSRIGPTRSVCAAPLHSGESPSEGADRRSAARNRKRVQTSRGRSAVADLFADFNGLPDTQRQDRVLSARTELVEPHDLGRQLQVMAVLPSAKGCAASTVHLLRSAVRNQIQLELSVVHNQPRRKGWHEGPHHARAGASKGISRHLAGWNSQLLDLPARPIDAWPVICSPILARFLSRLGTRMSIGCGR